MFKFPLLSINLCNTLYKTISRLLYSGMEEVLNQFSCGNFYLFFTIEFTLYIVT